MHIQASGNFAYMIKKSENTPNMGNVYLEGLFEYIYLGRNALG